MTNQVEVVSIKAVTAGNFKAFASVRIGGLTIRSLRIVQQPGQEAWVSLPQEYWTDKEGKRRYSAIVEVPDHIKQAISDAVLSAWRSDGH